MNNAVTATTTSSTAASTAEGPPSERKLPRIDPAHVVVDISGAARNHLFVRLPPDMVLDDLKEPKIWSRVQKSPGKSLRECDVLFLVSFDRSWAAEAVVAGADADSATITKPVMHRLENRSQQLLNDGVHAIVRGNVGYYCVRLKDNMPVTHAHPSLTQVEADFRNLYAVPVALGGRQ